MIHEEEIDGMRVCVLGQGDPIVFCHGYTTTAAFWKEQLEPFSQTHRIIAINLPGHGPSASPIGRRYTIDAFVDDVASVFTALSLKPAVLVGLSMGGTIAQFFALRFPERLAGLVLVGATPRGLGPDVQVGNVLAAIDEIGAQAASQRVIERSFGPDASDELVEFAKEEVIQTPEVVAREAIISLNEADTRDRLQLIHTPTLVITGDHDRITPPLNGVELAEGIPGARMMTLEKAGHFPMLENPTAFNRALREFLDQLSHS